MLTKAQVTLVIISSIIVILFAITYFALFRMAFTARVKLYENGIEDEKISQILYKKYQKHIKKHDTKSFVDKFNVKKESKYISIIGNVLVFIVSIICVFFVIIGVHFKINDQQLYLNNRTLLVIETGSMSEKHSNNTYLENFDNQIKAQSLVEIIKTDDYQIFDVCAFKTKDKIIVHRIVNIKVENGMKYYEFRGDANPSSLVEEIEVREDQILGELGSINSQILGTITLFLQSGIGMITILVSLLLYTFYSKYYDKEEKVFNERCRFIVNDKYNKYLLTLNSLYNNDPFSYVLNDDVILSPNIEVKNKDFTNLKQLTYFEKLLKNEEEIKDYYNEIKSYILSYKNVNNRFSKQYETFKIHNDKLFLLEIRGKTLRFNINYDMNQLNSVYHLNLNTSKKLSEYQACLKVKSNRSLKYAKEIIDIVLSKYNSTFDYIYQDYFNILKNSNKENIEFYKSYSFKAKLTLANEEIRSYYNKIKNGILSYKKINNRISFNHETFNFKSNKLFMLEFKGNTLVLHINDDIDHYDPKYHLKLNTNKKYLSYPIHIKLKSNRSINYALNIIKQLCDTYSLKYVTQDNNYLIEFEYKDYDSLINEGEIKFKERKW